MTVVPVLSIFAKFFLVKNNEFRSLLQAVILHWQQSAKAYAEYMENGKKFRYAEKLKWHNSSVTTLLMDNSEIIPAAFKAEVDEIIGHYAIWTAKWDELKGKLDPTPDDEFVFQNDHRFPKAAAQKLEAAFDELS